MLSDEEKKAIDELKEEINKPLEVPEDKFDTFILYNIECARTILNLIEKQSKEIEEAEQKEKEAYIEGTNIAYELCNKKWIEKIKATIEELDKQEKEVLKGTKGQDRYAIKQEYMHKRSGLQSLLGKE